VIPYTPEELEKKRREKIDNFAEREIAKIDEFMLRKFPTAKFVYTTEFDGIPYYYLKEVAEVIKLKFAEKGWTVSYKHGLLGYFLGHRLLFKPMLKQQPEL
jgi:hypothetical protein